MKRKHVLVAGGAGFIGTNLVARLLGERNAVTVIDNLQTGRLSNLRRFEGRPGFRFHEIDISRPLPDIGLFDEIYNLACAASPVHYQADPVHTLLTSIDGTHALLQLAMRSKARVVMASTSEVYGDPEQHPQTEAYFGNVNPTGPRACYDEGKRAAETLCVAYRERGVDVRVARIFNTYGPYMRCDDGRVVSNVICQALAGSDITIYGTGSQTRSFCFVDDLVEGLMRLMAVAGPVKEPVNLGNPEEFTINDMAKVVLAAIPTASRLVYRPLPVDDPRQRCPDITRARALLDWQPRVRFTEGLERTIAWFRTQVVAQDGELEEAV
jgi:UDP-glucuronate decarboxylase